MTCSPNRLRCTLSLLLSTSAVLAGCQPAVTPDFTRVAPTDIGATNAVRFKLGIRLVKDSWTFLYRQFGEEVWEDGSSHLCKKVKRDGQGRIAWEFDNYYSGKTYFHPDPDSSLPGQEQLIVHYQYGSTGR